MSWANRRIRSALIDLFASVGLTFFVVFALPRGRSLNIADVFLLLFPLTASIAGELFAGFSVGKYLLRLRLSNANGRFPTFRQRLARASIKFSLVFAFLPGLILRPTIDQPYLAAMLVLLPYGAAVVTAFLFLAVCDRDGQATYDKWLGLQVHSRATRDNS